MNKELNNNNNYYPYPSEDERVQRGPAWEDHQGKGDGQRHREEHLDPLRQLSRGKHHDQVACGGVIFPTYNKLKSHFNREYIHKASIFIYRA